MGYMTVVCILNDAWDTLKEHKDEFLAQIENGMTGIKAWNPRRTINSYPVGNHCNPIEVTRSFHADMSQLYLVGQNSMTDLTNTLGATDSNIEYLIEAQTRAKNMLEFGETNVCDYIVTALTPKVTSTMSDEEIVKLIKENDIVKKNTKYFNKKKVDYILKNLKRRRK